MNKEIQKGDLRIVQELYELVSESESELRDWVKMTDNRWLSLKARLQDGEALTRKGECYDETIWTFLLAITYAGSGQVGMGELIKNLTGSTECSLGSTPVWLEFLPLPPRIKEGNTNLDLCAGGIKLRSKTSGGIEYDSDSDFVLFCEMKWYSDISYGVTGDSHRNQLARVIENALCFQEDQKFPEQVFVTLVTPRVFCERMPHSRLYNYKLVEYRSQEALLAEFESCRLEKVETTAWKYPSAEINSRVNKLKLNHLSFESLFEDAPVNRISKATCEFLREFNGAV